MIDFSPSADRYIGYNQENAETPWLVVDGPSGTDAAFPTIEEAADHLLNLLGTDISPDA